MYDTQQDQEVKTSLDRHSKGSAREKQKLRSERAPFFLLLLWGAIISIFSFLMPAVTNLQSQNAYAGWAMTQGQTIYENIYGTSGLLYYLLNGVGNFFMGQLVFALLQMVVLMAAGAYLFQFAYHYTGKKRLARQTLSLFYLLVLGLGFGGFYATIFVLPFIFWGLWFILRYVRGQAKDKGFILYGAVGAFAFMVDPFTSVLFYGLAFLVLTAFNIARKKLAHGVYQLLADLLGFSIFFYPLGYYTVLNGSFGEAIAQVTYPLKVLSFSHSQLASNILLYVGLTFALGFLFVLIRAFTVSEGKNDWPLKTIGALGLLGVLLISILLPEQGAYQLLPALPFVMILFISWLNPFFIEREGRSGRARRYPSIWQKYLGRTFFLPALALIYLIGYPLVQQYILSGTQMSERATVSNYLQDKAGKDDKIYAWDTTASLYQSSGHLASASLLSPELYLGTEENQTNLASQLRNNPPNYVLVNLQVELLSDVKTQLDSNYKEIDLNLSQFKLYQQQ